MKNKNAIKTKINKIQKSPEGHLDITAVSEVEVSPEDFAKATSTEINWAELTKKVDQNIAEEIKSFLAEGEDEKQ